MGRARYICVEGVEGTGKSTQCRLLKDYLEARGYKVLLTKEPGTSLLPVTMELRGLMLDAQHDASLTVLSRELISQAIRSIHMEKLVIPALENYDFIIQDRGVLSGLSYGRACGNDLPWLIEMAQTVTGQGKDRALYNIYDSVLFFDGNASLGLQRAQQAKQEYAAGDAIEAKGNDFMETVKRYMHELKELFPVRVLNIDGKSIDNVHREVLDVLGLK